ncbi:GNAT family N-acetyltransferase [Cyanobacteria bacterium FACHB-63]|nr:GNAT family N-acetyltransferase [Cyanobacteria bacterium FACHB-63]
MNHQATSTSIQILATPSPSHLQVATAWLAAQESQNPNLEIALHLLLQGEIIPHERGGLVALAFVGEFSPSSIRGVVRARSGNTNVSMVATDPIAAERLFSLISARGCPQRLCADGQTKAWIHPLLLQHYHLQREYDQQVLICTHAPTGAAGRWAEPRDKAALQAYAAAYLAERGSGSLDYPWDQWIQQRRVAVLEHEGQIVAVVRRGETARCAIVVAPLTFPQFRRQGFARRLLAFFVQEMLQAFPAVKLWVDEDNTAAISLYQSLGFQAIGTCYTGYFSEHCS